MSNEVKSPWPGPKGLIPVTSGRADDANIYNRNYLDSIHLEMRIIDAVKPDLSTEIFGRKYSSPIMMPAFSHLNKVGKDGRKPMVEYARAAAALNVLNWTGMEPDEDFKEITETGADTVRIIKPFADHSIILDQISFAESCGAVAVGVDIDHVPGTTGGYDVVDGFPMGTVTTDNLKEYASSTSLPFVAKGVLSVSDALKAEKAGCSAIVVSHHHGRLPFGTAPVRILPDIKKALEGSNMKIFADCSVESGYDAYKLMALGAHCVSTGRAILSPLLKEGASGVEKTFTKLNQQLSEVMMYTSVSDTGSFDPSVLHF